MGSFTTNESSPLNIDFSATASGGDGVYTFSWDFGDGNVGTGQNTSHAYGAGATYDVTLTISDGSGNTPAVVSQQVTATEAVIPIAGSFTTNESSPLNIDFSATASGGDGVYTFNWDFGDGNVGTGQNVSHAYGAGATYDVTLTISDGSGNTPAIITQQVTATEAVIPIAGSFTTNESSPLNIDFSATASGGDGVYTFNWDFGDGNVGTGQNTSHAYGAGATYDVTLTISDGSGNTPAIITQQVTATEAVIPIAGSFTTNESSPLNIDFSATASGGDGVYTFNWDFGDGNVGTGQNVSHAYGAGATYDVTLTISDGSGNTPAIITQQVTATEAVIPIAGSFTTNESSPLNIDFSATASGGDGVYTFNWDFGDGNVGTGQNVSHAYGAGATYDVTLTISDGSGNTPAVISQQVTATEPAGPSTQETTPILPDINALVGNLDPIFNAGVGQGNRPSVFAVVGDETASSTDYLNPFGDPATYTVDPSVSSLQTYIDQYNTDIGDGTNSFNRDSVATRNGLLASDLLSPGANYDAGLCTAPGETLLQCELRITMPSVVFINIGYNDAIQGTDIATFTSQIEQIIQSALASNVIPVVTTVYPRLGDQGIIDRTEAINDAIITVANNNNVPVFNQWRGFNEIAGSGLQGDGVTPTVAPEGNGFLTAGIQSGANARNLYALTILESLNTIVFP